MVDEHSEKICACSRRGWTWNAEAETSQRNKVVEEVSPLMAPVRPASRLRCRLQLSCLLQDWDYESTKYKTMDDELLPT